LRSKAARVERNAGQIENRRTHVDRHFTVVLETRLDDPAERFDANC
jgi:hypothetical protein